MLLRRTDFRSISSSACDRHSCSLPLACRKIQKSRILKGWGNFEPPTKRFTNHPTQRECGHIRIIYKPTAIAQGTGVGKGDLALSQVAFDAGARGVLKGAGPHDRGRRLRGVAQSHRAARPTARADSGAASSGAAALTAARMRFSIYIRRFGKRHKIAKIHRSAQRESTRRREK